MAREWSDSTDKRDRFHQHRSSGGEAFSFIVSRKTIFPGQAVDTASSVKIHWAHIRVFVAGSGVQHVGT